MVSVALVHQPWNPAIPPVQMGSIAIWNYEVGRRLAARLPVTAIATRRKGQPDAASHQSVAYRRVPVGALPWSLRGRLMLRLDGLRAQAPDFAQPSYFGRYAREAAAVARAGGCRVVHLHNLPRHPGIVRQRYPGARIVLHMHCEWLTQMPAALAADCLAQVDAVVGCSDHVVSTITAALPGASGKCRALYNGVDIGQFRPPDAAGAARGERSLLFVGRLSPEKGLHVLMEAFAEVAARHPDVRLKIAGAEQVTAREFLVDVSSDPKVRSLARFYTGGSYREALLAGVPAEVAARIEFLGHVDHSTLPECYRAADIIVNPSFSESFGMSVIEAMACGRPVVTTGVGGMRFIVEEGVNGHLVEAGDAAGLAAALGGLLDEPERASAYGGRGRALVERRFSWDAVAESVFDLYRGL